MVFQKGQNIIGIIAKCCCWKGCLHNTQSDSCGKGPVGANDYAGIASGVGNGIDVKSFFESYAAILYPRDWRKLLHFFKRFYIALANVKKAFWHFENDNN